MDGLINALLGGVRLTEEREEVGNAVVSKMMIIVTLTERKDTLRF